MAPEPTAARPGGGAIGILGGTFDPIHLAHLRMAQEALEACRLDCVRFVPAGQPTHRGAPGASAAHRLAMTRVALARHPRFVLDESEALSEAPSYTVPTLERLRAEVGAEQPLVLLLGADAFMGLPSWHRWASLFDLAHIAVATRPGHALSLGAADQPGLPAPLAAALAGRCTDSPAELSTAPAGRVMQFRMTPLDISATAIRAAIRGGNSPCFLVSDGVLDYIESHKLYL